MSIKSIVENNSFSQLKKYNVICKMVFNWEITEENDIHAFLNNNFMEFTLNYNKFKCYNHYYLSLIDNAKNYSSVLKKCFIEDAKNNRDIAFYLPLIEKHKIKGIKQIIDSLSLLLTSAMMENKKNFSSFISLNCDVKNKFLSPIGYIYEIFSPLIYVKKISLLKEFIEIILNTQDNDIIYSLIELISINFSNRYKEILNFIREKKGVIQRKRKIVEILHDDEKVKKVRFST
jgi:hypothetical protein